MRKKFLDYKKSFTKAHAAEIAYIREVKIHPVMVPIITFIVLGIISTSLFLLFNGGHPQFKPIVSYIVYVNHDHELQTVPTNEPTVGDLLTKLNIKLNQGDVVEPSLNTSITQDNFHVNVYRAVPVEIIEGGQKTFTFSAAATPRAVAEQAGVKVYPEDYVSSKPTTDFVSQQSIAKQIIINPATPVNLNVYGTPTVVRTHAQTVAEFLADEHIVMAAGDSIQPASSTPVTPNMQIFLLHQGMSIQTVAQTIPMPIQTIEDKSLTFGTNAIRQQGSPGQELITYEVLSNGTKQIIQTVVTQQPVAEIIAQGQAVQIPGDKTAVMAEAGIPSGDYAYVNYIVSNESGWCPTKLQGEVGYCPGYVPSSIPSYLGYGLGQATPGYKMAPFGGDWESNPVTQLRWATSYADSKYGSWAGAYNFWYNHHYW